MDVGGLLVDPLRLVCDKRRADNIGPRGLRGPLSGHRNDSGARLTSGLELMLESAGVDTTLGGLTSNVKAVVVQDVGVGGSANNIVAVVLTLANASISRLSQDADAVVVQDAGVGDSANNIVAVVLALANTPVSSLAQDVDAIVVGDGVVGEKADNIVRVVFLVGMGLESGLLRRERKSRVLGNRKVPGENGKIAERAGRGGLGQSGQNGRESSDRELHFLLIRLAFLRSRIFFIFSKTYSD